MKNPAQRAAVNGIFRKKLNWGSDDVLIDNFYYNIRLRVLIFLYLRGEKLVIRAKRFANLCLFLGGWILFSSISSYAVEINGDEHTLKNLIELGYEKRSGNTDKESFAFKGRSEYVTGQTELYLNGSYNYETSKDEKIGNKGSIGGGLDYNITKKHAAFAFQKIGFDEFRKIDLKSESGLGWKYTFIKTDRTKFSFSAAGLYAYERLQDDEQEKNIFRASFRIKLKKKFLENSEISHITFYKPNFEEWSDDYLILSETALSVPLNKIFAIKVAIIDEYDNKPQEGVSSNDLTFTTTLVINF